MIIPSNTISALAEKSKKELIDQTAQELEKLKNSRPGLRDEIESALKVLLAFKDDTEVITFDFIEQFREAISRWTDPLSLNGKKADDIEVAA